jgi:hypothetical protein
MFLANIWTKNEAGGPGAALSMQGRYNENLFLGVLNPSGKTSRVQIICSSRQWQVSQLTQPPLKCLPITLHVWVVFGSLCRPHQDVDDLLHSEPLWRSSNRTRFLERAQKSCEPIFILSIQIADPRPRQR